MNVLLSCSASFAVTCSGASSAKLKSYFSIPLLLPKFAPLALNFLLCDFSVFSLLTSWHLTRCRVRKVKDSFKFYCARLRGVQHKNAKLQQLGTQKLLPRKRSPYLRFSILKIREEIKRKSGTKFENKKPAAKKKKTRKPNRDRFIDPLCRFKPRLGMSPLCWGCAAHAVHYRTFACKELKYEIQPSLVCRF